MVLFFVSNNHNHTCTYALTVCAVIPQPIRTPIPNCLPHILKMVLEGPSEHVTMKYRALHFKMGIMSEPDYWTWPHTTTK